jgi:hypothetical protein
MDVYGKNKKGRGFRLAKDRKQLCLIGYGLLAAVCRACLGRRFLIFQLRDALLKGRQGIAQ